MSWQTIAASETDANSPLNQTLMDKIRGNLEALRDGGAVTSAGLKTSVQEVSTNSDLANLELASIGEFGLYPSIKFGSSNNKNWDVLFAADALSADTTYKRYMGFRKTGGGSTGTIYAQVRYVQASRDEPVVWLLIRRDSGELVSSVFDPEARGGDHPFLNQLAAPDPELTVLAIELKRSDTLRKKLFAGLKEHGVLWQVHLALLTGQIRLRDSAAPLLTAELAPALHRPGVEVRDFELAGQGE